MPWSPSPIPRPAEPPVRVTVDGELFDVTTHPDHPGHYEYAWISGPNPGYGFGSQSSDGRPSTMVDHEKAIRNAPRRRRRSRWSSSADAQHTPEVRASPVRWPQSLYWLSRWGLPLAAHSSFTVRARCG